LNYIKVRASSDPIIIHTVTDIAMASEVIDVTLLFAIDTGATLVMGPSKYPTTLYPYGQHKRNFRDIEAARLLHVYHEAVRNGMPECGIEAVTPKHYADCDMSKLGSDMHCGACMFILQDTRENWPKEMVVANDLYVGGMLGEWFMDWSATLQFRTKVDELAYILNKVHSRYAGYVMLEFGTDPMDIHDIWFPPPWTEAWPEESVAIQFEKDLVARFPDIMKTIEHILMPQRVKYREEFVASQPKSCGAKRSRDRGTPWEIAPRQTQSDEINTLKRSLKLPSLNPVSNELKASIERALDEVVVETRQRAQNAMKHQKTSENKRRSEAPVLRYCHPHITKEVLDAVLALKGKKENVYENKASSRVLCVCCFLYLHGIPVENWVESHNFPRPPKRM
jgi:hypothetical protein